jgi:excisionase family DNA binding protein
LGKFTIVIKKNPSNKPLPPRAEGNSAPAMATVREACDYGRFGHTKCYDYINEGKIVAYKRGRRTMIDLDSIDAFNASLLRITPKEAVE